GSMTCRGMCRPSSSSSRPGVTRRPAMPERSARLAGCESRWGAQRIRSEREGPAGAPPPLRAERRMRGLRSTSPGLLHVVEFTVGWDWQRRNRPRKPLCYSRRQGSMPLHEKKVVAVLPAYNAEKTLRATYDDIPSGWVEEIVLVDDSSSDRTVEFARQLLMRVVVHPRNRG